MSTQEYAVVDPSTGDLVKEYPTATDEQIEQAVASAAKAHREWSRGSTVADRAALIRRVGELHTERKEALAKIIQREMGKPSTSRRARSTSALRSTSTTPTTSRSSSPTSPSPWSRARGRL